jgi:DNA-binding CsgD family transcriptional regulator
MAEVRRMVDFSPRERQVFLLLAKGFGNQEILTELEISLHTAKQYKSEVMRKLKVQTLAELIALASGAGTVGVFPPIKYS